MQLSTTTTDLSQQDFIALSHANEIGRRASRWHATAIFAKLSASGLVIASAGFGMVYAWTASGHHGPSIDGVPVLGALAVLMALSLECAKPLAIAGCLNGFRDRKIGQGILLVALGLIAIAYSLSAELSLMAMLRSDNTAARQSQIDAGADQVKAETQQAERYDAAKGELASLAASRPAAEVRAEIDGLLLTPDVNGCRVIDGSVTRKVCPKVATARAELARALRRTELNAVMSAPVVQPSPGTQSETVTVADPGAAALSTYLAVIGIAVSPERLADWLVLLGVLSLEAGSALAGVLAGSVEPRSKIARPIAPVTAAVAPVIKVAAEPVRAAAVTASATGAVTAPVAHIAASKDGRSREEAAALVTASVTAPATAVGVPATEGASDGALERFAAAHATVPVEPVRAAGRDEAAKRLLVLLRGNGGTIDASRHTLGKMIAATPSTAYAAVAQLAGLGMIKATPSSQGTVIRLAA